MRRGPSVPPFDHLQPLSLLVGWNANPTASSVRGRGCCPSLSWKLDPRAFMIGPIPRPTLLSTLIMFGGLHLFHVFRSVCRCLPTVRPCSCLAHEVSWWLRTAIIAARRTSILHRSVFRVSELEGRVDRRLLVDVIPSRACGKLIPVFQGSLGT